MLEDDLAHRRWTCLESVDQRRDGIIAEVGQEMRLPVVECTLRERRVQQTVLRAVRNGSQHVHHRRTERLDRRNGFLAVRQGTAMRWNDAGELRTRSVRRAE